MSFLKNILLKNFPILSHILKYFRKKETLKNVFHTTYTKKVLLSYITLPFKKDSFSHTNYFEVQSIARAFNELDYIVDVIDYESSAQIDLAEYDVICGFGDIFRCFFEKSNKLKIKTIYYAAGMHVCHQNRATLQRLNDVYLKKNIWLGKSARFVEKTWTHQTSLVDGIIALGNIECYNSYAQYYNGPIFSIQAPFYMTQDAISILNSRNYNTHKSFLWFGSSGLIHKGLDLLLDYFSQHPSLQLHICGNIEFEKEFVKVYQNELYGLSNICTHGFIDISDNKFCEILQQTSFIIYPSCSEGGSPSVVTAVGNGALIPLVSKESSFTTENEIVINTLDEIGIDEAVKKALSLNAEEIKILQFKNYEYVMKHNTQDIYFFNLKASILKILGDEK